MLVWRFWIVDSWRYSLMRDNWIYRAKYDYWSDALCASYHHSKKKIASSFKTKSKTAELPGQQEMIARAAAGMETPVVCRWEKFSSVLDWSHFIREFHFIFFFFFFNMQLTVIQEEAGIFCNKYLAYSKDHLIAFSKFPTCVKRGILTLWHLNKLLSEVK